MHPRSPSSLEKLFISHWFHSSPPRLIEYGFYFSVFYAVMGPAVGISVGFLGLRSSGSGGIMCLLSRVAGYTRPFTIAFPLGLRPHVDHLQLLFHNESLLGENVRPFITWMLALIVVQSLSLRQGFLQRFGLAVFLIGLMLLPYLRMDYTGTVEFQRAGLQEGVGLANPNDLAAWFGFCALISPSLALKRRV